MNPNYKELYENYKILEEENKRLRDEVERLRKILSKEGSETDNSVDFDMVKETSLEQNEIKELLALLKLTFLKL